MGTIAVRGKILWKTADVIAANLTEPAEVGKLIVHAAVHRFRLAEMRRPGRSA